MTVLDEFGDPDRSTTSRAVTKIAHAFPAVLVGFGVLSVGEWLELIHYERWPLAAQAVYFIAIGGVLLTGFAHQELARLCLRCMEAVPADAPIRAGRYVRLLWLSHRMKGGRYFAVVLPLIVLTSVARAVLDDTPGALTFLRAPVDIIVLAVLTGDWIHHRYRPWCPYCRDWGSGGDREPSPDPVGDGTKVA